MQKRSHKLLAATLLENTQGFQARRFELAFLFGSFQPDCNPLTYLKGSLRAYKFRGHNYSNSQHYIYSRMFRAPIWITSTSLKRGSWLRSISSVTMGRPVSCRATFRYSKPVAPRPWKE